MSNTIPPSVTPEAATWLRLQMTIAAGRAADPLRAELRDLDGFMNGLLVAVAQLVPAALEAAPEIASRIAPQWRHAAERFEALAAGEPATPDDEPQAQLEARWAMYRACEGQGLWANCNSGVRRPRRQPRRARH